VVEIFTIADRINSRKLVSLFDALYTGKYTRGITYSSYANDVILDFHFGAHGQEDANIFLTLASESGIKFKEF